MNSISTKSTSFLVVVLVILSSIISIYSSSSSSSSGVFAFTPSVVKGCFPCGQGDGKYPDKSCCAKGQMCPGNVPCCATEDVGAWSCNTSCTPVCEKYLECGNGNCAGAPDDACGACKAGSGCQGNMCRSCCPDGVVCGPSPNTGDACQNVTCGKCKKAGTGCYNGDCQECCPSDQQCGWSQACPKQKCGKECPSHQGCEYNQNCVDCCAKKVPGKQTCGKRSFCNYSCGECTSHQGCDGNYCQDCCPAKTVTKFPCGKSVYCDKSCGECDSDSHCIYGNSCKCNQTCTCSELGSNSPCGSCPSQSLGCKNCLCLGPKSATKKLYASNFVYEITQMYEEGCTPPAYRCGGYTPINSTSKSPFQIYYQGLSGFAGMQELIAIFKTPDGKPLKSDHLYLYFGFNNTLQNAGACRGQLTFQVSISNCTKDHYQPCWSRNGTQCFVKEGEANCHSFGSYNSIGNQTGIYVKNPGTSVFHVTLSVTDVYYQCKAMGNSNRATFTPTGISIEYSD